MEVYIKPFDLFEINGYWFVFRLKSLMHQSVLHQDVERLLSLRNHTVVDADDEVMELLKRYRLQAQVKWDEEVEHNRLLSACELQRKNSSVQLIELFVSQDCNMKCIYCYGSDGSYHQQGLMDIATAKQAIDWFYMHCDNPDNACIVFFGGEPLMNFPVVKQSIEYAEERFGDGKITYGMATNMTLMTDEYLDFFASLPKMYLLASIDGSRELHNRQRPMRNGEDSYELCTKNIAKALQRGIYCTGRATVYSETNRMEVYSELKRLGVNAWQLTPVSGCAADGVKRNDVEQLYQIFINTLPDKIIAFIDAIKKHDKIMADELMEDEDIRSIVIEGANGAEIQRNFMGCSAGRSQMAISATGDMYPCHRFVGMQEFCFGSILDNTIKSGWHEFSSSKFTGNPSCAKCTFRYACKGECYYQCYADGPHKSIFAMPKYFCEFMCMRFKLTIYVAHMLNQEDKRWYFTREYRKSPLK